MFNMTQRGNGGGARLPRRRAVHRLHRQRLHLRRQPSPPEGQDHRPPSPEQLAIGGLGILTDTASVAEFAGRLRALGIQDRSDNPEAKGF